VSVQKNFGRLRDQKLLTKDDWAAIGRLAREQILQHTAAGRDETGAAFAPYSDGYQKAKSKAGASTRVNLTLSGAMLGAITVTPDDKGVTLGFAS